MQQINLIKRSFVRQSHADDCGIACLSMIFHYAGKVSHVPALQGRGYTPGGLSLLDLRKLSQEFGLSCRCVEMEPAYLRQGGTPCILHTVTRHGDSHFLVCYGRKIRGGRTWYLVADPATQVHYLNEDELQRRWVSHTALYFDDLKPDLTAFHQSAFQILWSLKAYPSGLLLAFPLLSLFSASAGAGLSWLLQQGAEHQELMNSRLVVILLSLLFLINLCRTGLGYLRQYLLVRIGLAFTHRLIQLLMGSLFRGGLPPGAYPSSLAVKYRLGDLQKLQQANAQFLGTLLCEGSLVLAMSTAIGYASGAAGLIQLGYLVMVAVLIRHQLPQLSCAVAQLQQWAATTERYLLKDVDRLPALELARLLEERKKLHLHHYRQHLNDAAASATQANKLVFAIEALATVNVLTVFMACLTQLHHATLSYSSFMLIVILSYLSSSLLPKIASAVVTVNEGAAAAVQFRAAVEQRR